MKEIIKYEAFDGTIFEDEDECVEYERLKQNGKFAGQIHFFGFDKKPLKISCEAYEVYYVIVETVEAAMWWDDFCREEKVERPFEKKPFKPGFYWYDGYSSEWKCLEEEMEKLQIMADEFQQFIE
jgi:hypothetical protein